jgi:energy-coupling factor transporter ATP-binding protein EcfA2
MTFDYSSLFQVEDGYSNTWREVYDDSSPLSWNLLNILKCTILLPHDFYDIIAAYFLLPSALCSTVPYLFLYGQSGSGKSTVAKIASYLHGCPINSSSDTFAGIRNDLHLRRQGWVELPYEREDGTESTYRKRVERNICMVWDDVDSSVFTSSPDLYRLFKFGTNRATDKIILSSQNIGENLEFHCFCPKIFSSISPLHLDDRFRELRRRLIVIPCQRIEELSDNRKIELNVTDDDWSTKLLDLDAWDWKGFNALFEEFWDIGSAAAFVETRRLLSQSTKGLDSQQRTISLDLLATGITTGVWHDESVAIARVKAYWNWFKQETEKNAGLGSLLKEYISQEISNARNGNRELMIFTSSLRSQIDIWVTQGWLYEKPKPTQVKELMLDNGLRHYQGRWIKA